MYIFLARRKVPRRFDLFYVVFSSLLFLLITVWVAVDVVVGGKLWFPDQNREQTTHDGTRVIRPYIDAGAVAALTIQQMTDGLMMYRCRIVFDSPYVVLVPSILWLASLVLGVSVIWTSNTDGTNFFTGIAGKLGLAYYSVSVFLRVISTCMICCRYVLFARTVKQHLGEEHAALYFGIVMLLVESVLPCTLTGIAFLVSFGIQSGAEIAHSRVYVLMTCLSSQMLILRVAEGNAWQKDTMKPWLSESVIAFSPGQANTSGAYLGGSGTSICLDSSTGSRLSSDKDDQGIQRACHVSLDYAWRPAPRLAVRPQSSAV